MFELNESNSNTNLNANSFIDRTGKRLAAPPSEDAENINVVYMSDDLHPPSQLQTRSQSETQRRFTRRGEYRLNLQSPIGRDRGLTEIALNGNNTNNSNSNDGGYPHSIDADELVDKDSILSEINSVKNGNAGMSMTNIKPKIYFQVNDICSMCIDGIKYFHAYWVC